MTILRRTLNPGTVKDAMMGDNRHRRKTMNVRPDVLYGSDFETNPPRDGRVNVWLWSIVRASDGAFIVGETIEEWYEEVMRLNGIVCFHNLKYDYQFQMAYLMENSIGWDEEHTVIDAMNHIPYRLALKPDLYIQDTMRVHNTTLERMAHSYGLDGKSEKADFTVFHEYGHATDKEIEYVIQDSNIVAQVLKADCIENEGYIPVTGASYALKRYVNWLKTESGLVTPVKRRGENVLEQLFPCTHSEPNPIWWDALARMSYMGGLCLLKKGVTEQVNGLTYVYDVNSAYPYQMCSKPLPIGDGRYVKEYQPDRFGIYYGYAVFDHRESSCPIVHKSRSIGRHLPKGVDMSDNAVEMYGDSDYLNAYSGWLVLTSIEVEYLKRRAGLMLDVVTGYVFETRTDLFKSYIEPLYIERQGIKKSNPVKAEFIKLAMNSLYGKFGSDFKYGCLCELDDDGIYKESIVYDEVDYPWCYVPVATAITGYERVYIADMISDNWDGFLYTDTDSIHLSKPHIEGTIPIDQKRLGALKCESISDRSKYVRPKCYVHENEREYDNLGNEVGCSPISVKCGGMPQNIKDTIKSMDELHMGAVFEGKLMPRKYRGGVWLKPATYILNDIYRM